MLNLVRDDIDLAEITGTYGSERGERSSITLPHRQGLPRA
jgi:hypothetical protein